MPDPSTEPLRRAWTAATLRRFRRMLALVSALFIATEVVARAGIVPSLQPLSPRAIATDILFAIGFGGPLVLYLSGLPPWREMLGAFAAGGAIALGLGATLGELGVAQGVIGLGLGCLAALAWRAARTSDEARAAALLYLLPSTLSLVFTLQAGVFLAALPRAIPYTYDSLAYVADAGFGFQPSFAMGRLFASVPALAWVVFTIYAAPPPVLVYVYALQLRARRPPPVDAITVLLVLGLVGYALYFLYPVCGPLFAFDAAFPDRPPPLEPLMDRRIFVEPIHLTHPAWRNAMPSLHLGSVLLATWHVWPHGRLARLVTLVLLAGTVLATLGLGEHYLVDLIVALPFTLAVHALCTPSSATNSKPRARAIAFSIGMLVVWYAFLLTGTSLLSASPALTWGMSLATLAGVVALERGLSAAAAVERSTAPTERAPGPRTWWPTGHLLPFRRDPLELLAGACRTYGDVVRFRLGHLPVHLVTHPDHVRYVLVTNQANFDKDTRSSAKIRGVIGESLLTAKGDGWLSQRRLLQPAFKAQSVAALAGVMVDATAAMLDRWDADTKKGYPVDIATEMMQLTYTIVGKALFGAEVAHDIDRVASAVTTVMAHTYRQVEWLVTPPAWLPTPHNRSFRAALAELDALIYRIIDNGRLRSGTDVISLLLRQSDTAVSGAEGRQDLRNQAISLLLAGHETTANALTWTWYLLAANPNAAERLDEEVSDAIGDREPTVPDLDRLPWTRAVIAESMRLYPPIWIIERRVRHDDRIGDYRIPAGSSVIISPWVIHRHPALWDDPDRFDPTRFLDAGSVEREPFAYIPFGAGQRQCIGRHFAIMEAQVIVAMVAQRFRLELAGQPDPSPLPGITLRCGNGLPMMVRRRRPIGEAGPTAKVAAPRSMTGRTST